MNETPTPKELNILTMRLLIETARLLSTLPGVERHQMHEAMDTMRTLKFALDRYEADPHRS